MKTARNGENPEAFMNCWDNAPMESFFGHAKDELHLRRCSPFGEVVTEIADYIDYYNNWRP